MFYVYAEVMNLFNIPIENLTAADIDSLINNNVSESTMLDFKRDSYGGKDTDKKELIKDVSAMANTRGGMLFIGIDEEEGTASAICPISCNADAEIQRLNSILQSSIEPLIPSVEIRAINMGEDESVIVIKVPASWSAPHRTNFKGSKRFHRRNSAGVYEPDVTELKKMFNASIEQDNKFRALRLKHINAVGNGETPVTMHDQNSGFLLLQILPLQSLEASISIDLSPQYLETNLYPLGASAWDFRYNIDGYLTFRPNFHSYTQLHRNGIIEAVIASISRLNNSGRKIIAGSSMSEYILGGTAQYLSVLRDLGVQPPVRVYVTFLDIKDCRFATYKDVWGRGEDEIPNIAKGDVLLPPVDIMDYSNKFRVYEALKPTLDALWNADNLERCDYYDDEGNWVGHKDVRRLGARNN